MLIEPASKVLFGLPAVPPMIRNLSNTPLNVLPPLAAEEESLAEPSLEKQP
jgi:hypothetical protein